MVTVNFDIQEIVDPLNRAADAMQSMGNGVGSLARNQEGIRLWSEDDVPFLARSVFTGALDRVLALEVTAEKLNAGADISIPDNLIRQLAELAVTTARTFDEILKAHGIA